MSQHKFSSQWFVSELSTTMQTTLERYQDMATQISPDAAPLVENIRQLVTGGKRLRALLAWWGWQGAGGEPDSHVIIDTGVALELFQAAALIHDDILDRSDTRRGQASTHRKFEVLHRDNNWRTDPQHFGISAAILAGDLALALSEEIFSKAAEATAFSAAARQAFNTMRFEVMTGQYLDVLAESDVDPAKASTALERARQILTYKSAHYSTVWPLALGATLAGADESTLDLLREFSTPLGVAFQLRDDILGVFGDPELTGKPAGDDLREGKRTELVAHAMLNLSPEDAAELDRWLGKEDMPHEQVEKLQDLLDTSGAHDRVHTEVQTLGDQALVALEKLEIPDEVRSGLTELTQQLLHRDQ